MQINYLTKIARGQDGAIYNGFLFRLQMDGSCHVYDLRKLKTVEPGGYQPALCCFDLDKTDRIVPHSNAVFFGTEFYAPEDEFPLLYSNLYNNYADQCDRRMGTCCVYRVHRQGDRFWTTLVQLIGIDFVNECGLWRSADGRDVRSYGNFIIDPDAGRFYAYTMIDDVRVTRFFAFSIPRVTEGITDPVLGIPRLTLTKAQLLGQFDCPYQEYIQGACCHNGILYSLQGLKEQPDLQGLACVSLVEKRQIKTVRFKDFGLTVEPEFIDFYEDKCVYADNFGNTYYISL